MRGGVTFRLHQPLTHGTQSRVLPVLEVLFIAVEEEARHQKLGSAMVTVLQREGLRAGAEIMYVEIGRQQVEARRFWESNGMCCVRPQEAGEADYSIDAREKSIGVPPEMAHFFENRCLRFDDTEQWVKQIAESECEPSRHVPATASVPPPPPPPCPPP